MGATRTSKASALFADMEIRQGRSIGLDHSRTPQRSEDAVQSGCADEAQPIADLRRDEQSDGADENLPEADAVERGPAGPEESRQAEGERKGCERDGERGRNPDNERSPTKN